MDRVEALTTVKTWLVDFNMSLFKFTPRQLVDNRPVMKAWMTFRDVSLRKTSKRLDIDDAMVAFLKLAWPLIVGPYRDCFNVPTDVDYAVKCLIA